MSGAPNQDSPAGDPWSELGPQIKSPHMGSIGALYHGHWSFKRPSEVGKRFFFVKNFQSSWVRDTKWMSIVNVFVSIFYWSHIVNNICWSLLKKMAIQLPLQMGNVFIAWHSPKSYNMNIKQLFLAFLAIKWMCGTEGASTTVFMHSWFDIFPCIIWCKKMWEKSHKTHQPWGSSILPLHMHPIRCS